MPVAQSVDTMDASERGRLSQGIDTRPWITHRVPFTDVAGEFPKYLKPESGVIKAMISLE